MGFGGVFFLPGFLSPKLLVSVMQLPMVSAPQNIITHKQKAKKKPVGKKICVKSNFTILTLEPYIYYICVRKVNVRLCVAYYYIVLI